MYLGDNIQTLEFTPPRARAPARPDRRNAGGGGTPGRPGRGLQPADRRPAGRVPPQRLRHTDGRQPQRPHGLGRAERERIRVVQPHAAVELVERDGQKAIVIGDGGQRLKRIGTDARIDMEKLFGGKVMLTLWVKVKGGWSDDERALKSLGYDD